MACEQQGPVKSVLEGSFESNSSQDDIAEVFQQEFVTLAAKMGNHAVIRGMLVGRRILLNLLPILPTYTGTSVVFGSVYMLHN